MENETVLELSKVIEDAIADLRVGFRTSFDPSSLLDRFWRLQDCLNRLSQAFDDDPKRSRAELADVEHNEIVRRVVNLLEGARRLGFDRNAGIRASCDAINHSLEAIAQFRYFRATH